jgi:hypothetical protein
MVLLLSMLMTMAEDARHASSCSNRMLKVV